MTRIVCVDADKPSRADLDPPGAALRRAGLVAFPTETVYGLGADATDPEAIARLYRAKGRPATNPVIVHVANPQDAPRWTADWPEAAARLVARFWPGPLTLILPRGDRLAAAVGAGLATVAVRCPAHRVARVLIEAAGRPIAAPSANRSERLSPTTAEHVRGDLEGRIEWIVDAGPTPGGIESTVVDVTETPARVLRPGPIEAARLADLVPIADRVVDAAPRAVRSAAGQPARSPGTSARHYAPRTPLRLASREELRRWAEEEPDSWGIVTIGRWLAAPGATIRELPDDAIGAGAALYATLHDLDRLGLVGIAVERPPATGSWEAIADRLSRAAGDRDRR